MHFHGNNYQSDSVLLVSAGDYQRMFPHLPCWVPAGSNDQKKLDVIREYAVQMYADEPEDNPAIPAGYTYFGQFIDHDLTFDPTPLAGRLIDPSRSTNFRTPAFDLDSVYGAGPRVQPCLYRQNDNDTGFRGYLATGTAEPNPFVSNANDVDGHEKDLPRINGMAAIADSRNDENRIISQLHLAFIQLHNRLLKVIAGEVPTEADFYQARRIVRWFYQYVAINDFLKRLCDPEVFSDVLPTIDDLYTPRLSYYDMQCPAHIPVEFSAAVFRFGHSMVRPSYLLNDMLGDNDDARFQIFSTDGRPDLSGRRRLPFHGTVQWDWFLDFNPVRKPAHQQKSQLINPRLSRSVFHIPNERGSANPLAELNIRRGWRMNLPTGSSIAAKMVLGQQLVNNLDSPENSLWVYMLREAEQLKTGKSLGPMASRIVAEVFVGLLLKDPTSYLNQVPDWQPGMESALPYKTPWGDRWELRDIIRAAGVPVERSHINEQAQGVLPENGYFDVQPRPST